MTEIANFDIRYSELSDLEFLSQWFLDSASCDPFPFNSDEKEEALKNWIGFARFKASLTGTFEGKPCGVGTLFLMPYRKVAHHCSFFLIVDPEYRRRGIGTSMVRNLLHLAKTRFRLESVYVEIFEPSPLLSILQKLEFKVLAVQEDYVQVNGAFQSRVLLEHVFV